MLVLAVALMWFTFVFLFIGPGVIGFVFPKDWWPLVWPFVGLGLIALSLYVSVTHLPDPDQYTSDGTSWAAVLFLYLAAGAVGIGTAYAGVALRKKWDARRAQRQSAAFHDSV